MRRTWWRRGWFWLVDPAAFVVLATRWARLWRQRRARLLRRALASKPAWTAPWWFVRRVWTGRAVLCRWLLSPDVRLCQQRLRRLLLERLLVRTTLPALAASRRSRLLPCVPAVLVVPEAACVLRPRPRPSTFAAHLRSSWRPSWMGQVDAQLGQRQAAAARGRTLRLGLAEQVERQIECRRSSFARR